MTKSDTVFELPIPDDFHVHLRQLPELRNYAATLSRYVGRALVMPNTVPPISTPEGLARYRGEIVEAAPGLSPLPTFKLLPSLDPDDVPALIEAGAVAGKLYPAAVTTNAEDGFDRVEDAEPLFGALEAAGAVLCIHAEAPEAGVFERERAYLPAVEGIVSRHPKLRIVVEHVSDAETVGFVEAMPDTVAATVTPHHLLYTVEDLLASGIRPHLYCKPVVKRPADREALQRVVLDGHPRFFFGSDSAPHPVSRKESAVGAAGVYNAPTGVPLLLSFFARHGKPEAIIPFVSRFGAAFYRLDPPTRMLRLVREPWVVPDLVDGAVPLAAGTTLDWRAVQSD